MDAQMPQAGKDVDELVQRAGANLSEREMLQPRVPATQRLSKRFPALAAERSVQPAELRERRQVELPSECGDAEDERAQLLEPRQRLQRWPAVGEQVEIAHLRQLLQQGQVPEIETEGERVYLACSTDHGCCVGVVVARVPEPAVGLDRIDERRWQPGA